jgi:hypothetical protein
LEVRWLWARYARPQPPKKEGPHERLLVIERPGRTRRAPRRGRNGPDVWSPRAVTVIQFLGVVALLCGCYYMRVKAAAIQPPAPIKPAPFDLRSVWEQLRRTMVGQWEVAGADDLRIEFTEEDRVILFYGDQPRGGRCLRWSTPGEMTLIVPVPLNGPREPLRASTLLCHVTVIDDATLAVTASSSSGWPPQVDGAWIPSGEGEVLILFRTPPAEPVAR